MKIWKPSKSEKNIIILAYLAKLSSIADIILLQDNMTKYDSHMTAIWHVAVRLY